MNNITPRLLSADEAAHYLGLSRSAFLVTVAKEILPLKIGVRRLLWDRIAIDRWIDARSGIPSVEELAKINPLDALL